MLRTAYTTMSFGTGTYTLEVRFTTPSAASDATDDYGIKIGFGDSTAVNANDGAWLRYNKDSANFIYVTKKSAAEQTTDSGLAFAASTTYRLRIVADTDSALFTINGANSADVTLQFPTGANVTGINAGIHSAAGASRTLSLDYIALKATGLTR